MSGRGKSKQFLSNGYKDATVPQPLCNRHCNRSATVAATVEAFRSPGRRWKSRTRLLVWVRKKARFQGFLLIFKKIVIKIRGGW